MGGGGAGIGFRQIFGLVLETYVISPWGYINVSGIDAYTDLTARLVMVPEYAIFVGGGAGMVPRGCRPTQPSGFEFVASVASGLPLCYFYGPRAQRVFMTMNVDSPCQMPNLKTEHRV